MALKPNGFHWVLFDIYVTRKAPLRTGNEQKSVHAGYLNLNLIFFVSFLLSFCATDKNSLNLHENHFTHKHALTHPIFHLLYNLQHSVNVLCSIHFIIFFHSFLKKRKTHTHAHNKYIKQSPSNHYFVAYTNKRMGKNVAK